MIYLDTSAAIKLVLDEDGTAAMRSLVAGSPELISSRLLAVEMHAVADRRAVAVRHVREVLDRVELVALEDDVASRAIGLHSGLRALDALHLATALDLGDAVTSFLAFDDELLRAAAMQGLTLHALP